MEKLNFADYNFGNHSDKEKKKKDEDFGKLPKSALKYHKKNRMDKMNNAARRSSSGVRNRQIEVGTVVYTAEQALKNILSEELLSEIKIQSYKNNKLYLTASNSLIAQELKFEKGAILDGLKNQKVEDIVIMVKAREREEYN